MTGKTRLPKAPANFVEKTGVLTRDASRFLDKLYRVVVAVGSPGDVAGDTEQRLTDVENLAESNKLSSVDFGVLSWR